MLESLVAGLLNRTLGNYVENFDPKQLNIGIWSGDVTLKNLKLKKESLDKLELPIDVQYGFLGQLTMQIPWSNLRGKPVKIIIEDAYLLATPMRIEEYDEDKMQQRELALKRQRLQDLDLVEENKSKLAEEHVDETQSKKQESFTESLLTKIVDNLQVTIKNIHIRYEDDSVFTASPYAVGITLHELSAVSTDQSWVASAVSLTSSQARKLVTLRSLSSYFNSHSVSLLSLDEAQLLARFRELIAKEDAAKQTVFENHHFVLEPVTGSGKITINKLGTTETDPHVLAELFFKEFAVTLDSDQYRDILTTASNYRFYAKTLKFRKYRPTATPAENPREWFRYAATAVRSEIHDRNYRWSWAYLKKRRDERRAYIKHFQNRLRDERRHAVPNAETARLLQELEDTLSYEDVKFYRSLARTQFRKEQLQTPKTTVANTEKPAKPAANRGWFGWWNGSPDTETESESTEALVMTEEQKKEFFDAIEYDEHRALAEAVDVPKDRAKLKLFASLERGAFRIRNKNTCLAEAVWAGCNFELFERPNSVLSRFTLQEFRVEDSDDSSSLYKHIVSIKPMPQSLDGAEVASSTRDDPDPFFQVSFESNPLDESADSKLMAKLKSMTIFYHARFVEKIVKFFTPPKQHQDTISALMNAAEATVEGLTAQTKLGLRYALEEHKTVNAQLDLQAPLIILPLDPDDGDAPCGIIDAGHISVMSDLIDKNTASELKQKSPTEFSDGDWSRLNELMYDKFNLRLHDAQLLIGPTIKSTIEQLHAGGNSALILKDFDTNFLVQVSILPQAHNLAKFKVTGDVPSIKAKMSDYQYKVILALALALVPEFSDIGYVDEDSEYLDDVLSVFQGDNEFTDALSYIEDSEDDNDDDDDANENDEGGNDNEVEKPVSRRDDHQNQFEFNFKVGEFNLTLLKCVESPFSTPEAMVDLVCDNFKLDFVKTVTDMQVDLVLSDVNLVDRLAKNGPEEHGKILSSNNFTQRDIEQGRKEDLVRVKYTRSQRIVDVNGEEIELYDQAVKLDVAAVKAMVNRKNLLTIYTYVMTTFTGQSPETTRADVLRHNSEENNESAPQKISVTVGLERIIVVLLDEHVELATLQLSTGDVRVLLLPEKMRVHFRLGALTLHDEINEGSPRDSITRRLVSIEGDDVAEVTYETFDATTNTNLYNSKVQFKSGSMRVNLIEEPFKKIFGYVMTFAKMKGLFDNARDSNYHHVMVTNDREDTNRMAYDILVRTPIIVFPKLGDAAHYDTLTAYLGEFKASNSFAPSSTTIDASLTSTQLVSELFFNNSKQFLKIIDGIDMTFQAQVDLDGKLAIQGTMSDTEMMLTEYQLQYLMHLVQTVPGVFQYDEERDMLRQVEQEDAVRASMTVLPVQVSPEQLTDQLLEQSGLTETEITQKPSQEVANDMLKVDFKFNVGRLALSIYNETSDVCNVVELKDKRLSRFSLNGIEMDLKLKQSSHYVSNILVRSFTVEDIRVDKDNLFTEIIPTVTHDNYQFSCKIYSEGSLENKRLTLMLTVDSPKMILALDYLFALKDYVFKGLGLDSKPELPGEESQDEETTTSDCETAASTETNSVGLSYTINVTDFSLILLSDPTSRASEAIVLKLEQLLVSSQDSTTLMANNVGLFLCKMDDFEGSRLRIIDDFSASFAYDAHNSTATKLLSTAQISIEPLLLRLSLSDIRLALNIINKAYELAGISPNTPETDDNNQGYTVFTKEFRKKLSKSFYASSITSEAAKSSVKQIQTAVVKAEAMSADFAGLRLVVLGDVHELPVVDMNVKPFTIQAENWSTNLDMNTQIESYVNIFNYARSSWEPLVDPWKFGVHVTNEDGTMNVDVISRETAEVTLSARSITLLSQMYSLVSLDISVAPRGANTPYTILNQTGYDIRVWIDAEGTEGSRDNETVIRQNQQIPWQFEDWTEIREKLDVDSNKGSIAVELVGSPYKVVEGISLIGEGEDVFMMMPPIQGVHNRLACSVVLTKENVKQVVLRSTVTVANTTDVELLVGVGLLAEGVNEVYTIAAGETFALPVDRVYREPVAVRPGKPESGSYGWSVTRIHWKSLYNGPAHIECRATDRNSKDPAFYLRADAVRHSERTVYPHMQIVISAPLQVENLLPYDMSYLLYDKTVRRTRSGVLAQGASSNIHCVDISHLLLMRVQPLDCGFGKSEFAVINAPELSDFPVDSRLDLRHDDGQKLGLRLDYRRGIGSVSGSGYGSGLKVAVYSPYVVLNRTGQDVMLGEKYNALHSVASASLEDATRMKASQPKMFSFEAEGERRNRAFLSVADSQWSRAVSLDAIGQFFDLAMPVPGKQSEVNVGVDIREAEGKYAATKVVTVAPRFIISNNLEAELSVNEIGAALVVQVRPGESVPWIRTCAGDNKQLRIRFPGSSSKWSAPFGIQDIGELHLKVLRQNAGHVLLKVVVLLENATLFVRLENAGNDWPYSIRNFSNTEFLFYQSNPYTDETGAPVARAGPFKPVFYRIPAKSVMPYAWDYPAGAVKELVLRARGRDRSIQLAEIGNLGVMRLPAAKGMPATAVDINMVADGPTQALVISDADPHRTERETSSSITTTGAAETEARAEAEAELEHYEKRVAINFRGLGVSIINAGLQELCYVTLRGIEIKYNESELYQTVICNLKWVQVDNQLFGGMFPIVLYPSVVPQSGQDAEVQPTFHVSGSRVKDDSHGVLYIKYATVLLQEMSVDMDEDFLFALLEMFKIPLGGGAEEEREDVLCEQVVELPRPSKATLGRDIYFEALHLQPTQINLSFVRTERVNAEDLKPDSPNAVMFFLNVLTMAIGNVNDAPLKLNALFIENIRVPLPVLAHSVQTHYTQDLLFQLHKVLGSADFLGNPVGLFNNISSGVMDIFYEPYQGLVMNDRPQELGISIAKGGLSFLKKSVFGVSDSVARFTGSVAKGLSLATLDRQYQERRRYNLRRNRPKHALVGFKSGASSFFESLTSGVSGIALAPIEGASSEGTSGFFKGIGKGIVGLPTKTAIGVFDLASNVSEGIRNTTTVFDNNAIDKARLPRAISYDGIIRKYSPEDAQGQYWLKTINGGEFSTSEKYLAHLVLPGADLVLLITFRSIMLVSVVKLELRWRICFQEIKSIVLEKSGIKIGLFDNRAGPFIPIPDVHSKKYLYNRIAVAVNLYNRQCQSIL